MAHGLTIVKCKDCDLEFPLRNDCIKAWQGKCLKCSRKYSANLPHVIAKKRIDAKTQVLKQGGIANAVKFKSVIKELHPHWKGGKPKCIDCNKELSAYSIKRCTDCFYKHNIKENHWNWKGGLTDANTIIRNSLEYKNWRKNVFQRDGWRCVICDYRSHSNQSDIRADHILPFHLYPELRLDISNGRTLCVPCDKVHGYNYHRDKNKLQKIAMKTIITTLFILFSATINAQQKLDTAKQAEINKAVIQIENTTTIQEFKVWLFKNYLTAEKFNEFFNYYNAFIEYKYKTLPKKEEQKK